MITFFGQIRILQQQFERVLFWALPMILFLSHLLFLYSLSSDALYSLDDESGELGSDSGLSGTHYFCAFYLRFDKSIVSVIVLGSDLFAPTGVESKFGRLLALFWCSNCFFSPNFKISFIVIV